MTLNNGPGDQRLSSYPEPVVRPTLLERVSEADYPIVGIIIIIWSSLRFAFSFLLHQLYRS